MTSGDIEDFGTSWKRVKIHVGSMGFARWDHTGSGVLYNGADRREFELNGTSRKFKFGIRGLLAGREVSSTAMGALPDPQNQNG